MPGPYTALLLGARDPEGTPRPGRGRNDAAAVLVRAPPHTHERAHQFPAEIEVGLRRSLVVQTFCAHAYLEAADTVGGQNVGIPAGKGVWNVKTRNTQLNAEVAGCVLGQLEAQRRRKKLLGPGSCV